MGTGMPPAGGFTCNLVLGLFTTGQWFDGGFLMDGVDPKKWEAKTQKYSYVEKWMDPANQVWSVPIRNQCATNAMTPDRIVFVGFSPVIQQGRSQAGWEMLLTQVVATIKMKFPSAQQIYIQTMCRAPNNMLCANNNDPWTVVPPYEDMAFDAFTAASGGTVVEGPKCYVPDCATSWLFANDTDYTTKAAASLAMQIATFYVAHP
jgi:hypothetical protein